MSFLLKDFTEEENNLLDSLIHHERRYKSAKQDMERSTREAAHHRDQFFEARHKLIQKGVRLSGSTIDA